MGKETGCSVYRTQLAMDSNAQRPVPHKDNQAMPKPRELQASLLKLRRPFGFGMDGAGSFKAEITFGSPIE
jgi:hypothetical protein